MRPIVFFYLEPCLTFSPKLWSISGLLSYLRFGGDGNDELAEDLVRSDASSSSNDEDEGLQVQEQDPPQMIPVRRIQVDRNSAPEFVLPLPPGDVPPGHEVCRPLLLLV